MQAVEGDAPDLGVGGSLSHQHCQLMVDDVKLEFQGRKRGLSLGEGGLLNVNIVLRNSPRLVQPPGDLKLALLKLEDLPRDRNLRLHLRLSNRGGDHVTRQHEPRPLELPALVIGLGVKAFNQPPVGAEEIEGIRHRHRSIQQ